MDLTYKQRLFVEYYLGVAGGNATDAARRAGYRHPNVAGPRLLVNVGIRTAVDARLESAAMAANEVLARLSEHATADLGDFLAIGEDGAFAVDLSVAKKARRTRLLKKLKVTAKTTTISRGKGQSTTEVETKTEIELHNPQFALDKLAQYHGLYEGGRKTDGGDAPRKRIIIPGVDERPAGREHPGTA